ncbi:hypothetical protein F5X68DRAFT_166893 [Plectosphaerella plurivora]|uniref:Uncharacterized protein n=1 Tax=Plectosphaerella plurivora TaxID=936078 RepID=A0A9P9A9R1_9PEZI|nr:hypothetical protein F5X68DRAFT_166893 [Plectosphaerella plurivora]
MDENTNDAPGSGDSSPFPLEPITASVLRRKEQKRRDVIAALGPIAVGCGEIDEYVLLGGLDRGSVIGLSAEDEAVGLRIALQAVARGLVRGDKQRAMVVTTQPVTVVLPVLRDAVRLQLVERGVDEADVRGEVRGCLERVVISRVFDLEGLWEVLEDLDVVSKETSPEGATEVPEEEGVSEAMKPETKPASPRKKPPRVEIADSEDEGDFSAASSSPLSSAPASTPGENSPAPAPREQSPAPVEPTPAVPTATEPSSLLPDMIIITHFSSILATLFARRDTKPAHTALHLLSSHLRHLSRTLASNPLIMLLNTTASSAPTTTTAPRPSEKPLDPSLRSVFNPPPVGIPGYRHGAASRRNKPSYGLVFAQLLDVHLLCTRVPREAGDAERLYAPRPGGETEAVRYVWVLEVLLDEVGTWEGGRRRFREQRWGAVDVVGGKVVDAFEKKVEMPRGEIRTVGGFGGPRV